MTPDTRRALIAIYGQADDALRAALAEFPRAMWQYRPAPDRWTIHEIIVHITDSEVNSYLRCRRAIAEPGSTVLGYDEMGWATALRYHQRHPDDALDLFRGLRRASYHLIRDLPEATWAQTIQHSENGTMSLDDWLVTYAAHVRDHIAQMRQVYADWRAAQG